jgi:hypothetical protein
VEKEELDRLTVALYGAGYKIIAFQMDEYSTGEMPEAIGNEDRRLTGAVKLKIRPVTARPD